MFKKLFSKQTKWSSTLSTDSGMLGIWNYSSFKHINDYDSWENELCDDEDIQKPIHDSRFIPLNLGDGVFKVEVRIDSPENMSPREKEYLLVPSKPYKLKSTGLICVSGLEHISEDTKQNVLKLDLKKKDYTVYINLIDWNQEPGALNPNGGPTENALPDMLVFITENHENEYRTDIETFRKEDAQR
jgi:hypothetical protein